jgi:hypothetical protein
MRYSTSTGHSDKFTTYLSIITNHNQNKTKQSETIPPPVISEVSGRQTDTTARRYIIITIQHGMTNATYSVIQITILVVRISCLLPLGRYHCCYQHRCTEYNPQPRKTTHPPIYTSIPTNISLIEIHMEYNRERKKERMYTVK